ncbi:MAG: valine--tRNA ligase [bacterium]|nr:valine--tRNA ligase [bacterium]
MSRSEMMDKAYKPSSVEERLYRIWEENGYFKPRPPRKEGTKPYVIVIPPPNVTGILHMGHVLNNALQDILIRWKRMEGIETVWVPGCDHAGIATQNVVARKLRDEGRDPKAMPREEFLEVAWTWKDEYHDRIIGQLKKLGCSCDWERERFTLDEGLSRAVQQVFIEFFNEGLIYKGEYIVNWDPQDQTALSDEEVEFKEVDGHLWHFRYPLATGDGYLVVATTRPETMLGDTGVAINPKDESKDPFRGRRVKLPLVGREIPIVEDNFVDPEFGTGFVKVTPAHDPNDFEMGRRHKLASVVVIGPDGRMNDKAGEYAGLTREEARKRIVADMEALGLLDKVEDYRHSVGHGQRSGVPIEPYLSAQWYVKMEELARPAVEAVKDGRIRFTPARWEKTYMHWLENIRDWCISRQLIWGHRIPVWTHADSGEQIAAIEAPDDSGKWVQDPDVLDTWFSSWLWPFSILGWPDRTDDLEKYYPSTTLVTGADIIFFWVARMIMAGLRFQGEIPFSEVFFNGIVRDTKGRKMSKSLGNSPDPIDLMEVYGVDAVRFSMTMLTPLGGDYLFEDTHMEMGRNFANKLWNASRYVLGQLDPLELTFDGMVGKGGDKPIAAGLLADWAAAEWLPLEEGLIGEPTREDRWILSRLAATADKVRHDLESFRFNDAARGIYDFLWKEFCDWYLELTKPRVYGDDKQAAATALLTSAGVLHATLRLLHPFMPYVTEAIWERFPGSEDRIIVAPYPELPAAFRDEEAEADLSFWMETISLVRGLRKEINLSPAKPIELIFRTDDQIKVTQLEDCRPFLASLARVEDFRIEPVSQQKPKPAAGGFLDGLEIWLPLVGLVDLAEERARLAKELKKTSGELKGLESKLGSTGFTAKAPPEVVEKTRIRLEQVASKAAKLQESLENLQEEG